LLSVEEWSVGLTIFEEIAIEWNFTHKISIIYQITVNSDRICIGTDATVGLNIESVLLWA
jgi:hypothetical protein